MYLGPGSSDIPNCNMQRQPSSGGVKVQNTALERVLIDPEPTKRISRYYKEIGLGGPDPTARTRIRWTTFIPELTEELWQEVLDTYLVSVISSTDRMIQLRYLHQMYYTPTRLFKMHIRDNPECHKCGGNEGTFLHMVWDCPKIRPLWSQVTEFISDHFDLPNICSPMRCLLGGFDQEEINANTKLFLRLLYFGMRKLIAQRWIHDEQLTLGMWIKIINADILLYKMTYEARGAPKKFRNVWYRWTESKNSLPAEEEGSNRDERM